ncbi:IclR family transcriptional regulator [Nocardioides sp.]|uniref:IclR family transcriptional regulator n=1 Tax=Nocardioides sp. TaxID=35761 RepID=UPI003784AA24
MTSADDGDARQPRIQSVARAAGILSAVAGNPNGLTPKDVSVALDLRLPTTYHLLQTLEAVGLLRREGGTGSRYLLGFGVGQLARGFDRQVSVPEQLAAVVRAVAERTGESVYASGWSDGEIVILDRQIGTHPVGVAALPIGLAGHAYARASGKLLLALMSEEERETYFARHDYAPLTPSTLSMEELVAQLDVIREQGYALDDEEHTPGVCCVAAPFELGGRQFCVALSAPSDRFRERQDDLIEAVCSSASSFTI